MNENDGKRKSKIVNILKNLFIRIDSNRKEK